MSQAAVCAELVALIGQRPDLRRLLHDLDGTDLVRRLRARADVHADPELLDLLRGLGWVFPAPDAGTRGVDR